MIFRGAHNFVETVPNDSSKFTTPQSGMSNFTSNEAVLRERQRIRVNLARPNVSRRSSVVTPFGI